MMGLRFVTGPMHLDAGGAQLRRELGNVLADLLRMPVEVSAEESYAALEARVQQRGAELCWLPPALFVRAHDAGVVAHTLRPARNAAGVYQGALFVKSDGPIRTAADLSGARVAWVDRSSCAGYLFPRLALAEHGIAPTSLFAAESFLESHGRVVRAVLRGEADVGATFVQLADENDPARGIAITGWTGYTQTKTLRAVLVSGSIPSDPVCVVAGAPQPERIAAALAELHAIPGASALLRRLLSSDRLEPAPVSDYEVVRRALRA